MKSNLIEDMSILTTLSESTLGKLSDKAIMCISDAVERSVDCDESLSDIDIGIGTLTILHTNSEVKYRFVPNDKLEKAVSNTVILERNCLTNTLESTLVSKVNNVYKNFF